MKIIVVDNYDEMSAAAADIIYDVVQSNPEATLGLATGSTPIGCYELLADFCARKKLSFKKVKAVNLDEYVGLRAEDKQSYAYFMRQNLFDKVDIDRRNTYIPDGMADDLENECKRYSDILNGISRDLQVLGLGSNGHIGFNEPNTPFDSTTHIVELAASTIADNARLFDDEGQVPRKAITMGISEIMKAKRVVMLVSGGNKAEALRNMAQGKISSACPASILQRHPDCTVIADKQAARLLQK
ncbi:MAG: glucosamine-6-phosphate deaminase [Corallococcus sp.]|nr:glucosamine-6-phosphate deaminase [Bacillota bacterium]MCM1533677.1 glucosamine-6-phosphate deaminase [Corallococcus sp.]